MSNLNSHVHQSSHPKQFKQMKTLNCKIVTNVMISTTTYQKCAKSLQDKESKYHNTTSFHKQQNFHRLYLYTWFSNRSLPYLVWSHLLLLPLPSDNSLIRASISSKPYLICLSSYFPKSGEFCNLPMKLRYAGDKVPETEILYSSLNPRRLSFANLLKAWIE